MNCGKDMLNISYSKLFYGSWICWKVFVWHSAAEAVCIIHWYEMAYLQMINHNLNQWSIITDKFRKDSTQLTHGDFYTLIGQITTCSGSRLSAFQCQVITWTKAELLYISVKFETIFKTAFSKFNIFIQAAICSDINENSNICIQGNAFQASVCSACTIPVHWGTL